jgi:hypothetical protein
MRQSKIFATIQNICDIPKYLRCFGFAVWDLQFGICSLGFAVWDLQFWDLQFWDLQF